MPKRIEIKPHLSIEQLATCYRKSEDAVERSHYQMIWLLAQGQSTAEVARVTGYSVYWVRVIARRYNAQGDKGARKGCQGVYRRGPLLDFIH
jgi:hypothetical protein